MRDELVSRLTDRLGPGAVLTEPGDVEPFCADWFGRYRGQARAVVLPRSTEEVSAAVTLCAAAGAPVVPQGGNTSVCGGSTPDPDGRSVVVSLSRMNRVRRVDTATNAIVVDAGCVLKRVQEAADAAGRLFPLSLGAEGSCQIGGNVSTNAGGVAVVRYGNMRDLVLGLEAVLPDGQIWDGLRAVRKDSTGYDLKSLLIGAEGTLGIVTGAALKLFPKPRDRAVAWVALPSAEAAIALLSRLQELFDTKLTAFEVMSRSQLAIVWQHVPNTRPPLDPAHPWSALVEVSDTLATAGLAAALEEALAPAIEDGAILDAVLAGSDGQAGELWAIRHSLSDALKAAGQSLSHDVAVPISAVADYIARTDEIARARFPQATPSIVSHLGDGNVHYNLTFPRDYWASLPDPSGFTADVARTVQESAVALGGTFVAEHGIGRKNLASVARFKSPVELATLQAIKRSLDPAGLFNPGKTIPA